ncbi:MULTISPECIES: hypothetical protein, partial [Streptomyces]|uniref:hypothetical protein n=1 Tax=Streptomyces TaxID=1883 RepID=UPI001ADFADC0
MNSRSLIRSTGTGDYHRHGRTAWTYFGSELLQGVFRRPIRELLTGLSESAVVPPGLPALEWWPATRMARRRQAHASTASARTIATRLRITRANGTPNEAVVTDEKPWVRKRHSSHPGRTAKKGG